MSIAKHTESHLDHNLSAKQLAFVLAQDPTDKGDPASPVKVFTVEMPAELGTLPCGLYGPACGDKPIIESSVQYMVRGNRKGASRLIKPHEWMGMTGDYPVSTPAPLRPSNKVTIVAGPHDGHDWVLFTSYGGPEAPREPFEFEAEDTSPPAVESREFWATHALTEG